VELDLLDPPDQEVNQDQVVHQVHLDHLGQGERLVQLAAQDLMEDLDQLEQLELLVQLVP
jgi:hypothetical protein